MADRHSTRGLREQELSREDPRALARESRLRRERKDSGVVRTLSDEAKLALDDLGRALVGQMSLKDAQRALRTCMSQEALARCNGSRRAAATLLGIDRRYVQRLVANEGDADIELDGTSDT